jgi:hypothetical protein
LTTSTMSIVTNRRSHRKAIGRKKCHSGDGASKLAEGFGALQPGERPRNAFRIEDED